MAEDWKKPDFNFKQTGRVENANIDAIVLRGSSTDTTSYIGIR